MANKSVINPGKYHLGFTFDFPPYQNEQYVDTNEIKQMRWKTSVIMNRRAYVGNVKMTEYDGTITVLSDSIFKSRTNKFDSFTKDRRIDVAVGDGEDIVALAGFGDMLLQFKETTLHIINCSGASEFLEGTYKFKGLDHPASVCNTSFGIAWANKFGMYFFDGRQVVDIFSRRGMKRIKPSTWTTFAGSDILRMGFLPNDNVVICVNNSGDMFMYDMVTQSITTGEDRIGKGTYDSKPIVKSNLVSIWDGQLVAGIHDGTANEDMNVKVVKANATAGSSVFELITKEVDGSSPTQEKKWKTAYITYRYSGVNKIAMAYKTVGKDGSSAWVPFNEEGGANKFNDSSTDSAWKTTKFKIGVKSYTMQIKIYADTHNSVLQEVPKEFEINDITLVYRDKSVK